MCAERDATLDHPTILHKATGLLLKPKY